MSQKYAQKQRTHTEDTVVDESAGNTELDQSVEDVLTDIDDILEENAQDFISGFIQEGGE